MTNWMTAAGLALIAGGLATLISFRAILFGGGERRRARRQRRSLDAPRRRPALPAAARPAENAAVDPVEDAAVDPVANAAVHPAVLAVHPAEMAVRRGEMAVHPADDAAVHAPEKAELAEKAPRRSRRGRRRALAAASEDRSDDERGGLASIGLADDEEESDPARFADIDGDVFAETGGGMLAESEAAADADADAEAEQPEFEPVAARPDRYADRVEGWVRPEYQEPPDEPRPGEYWTPIPVDLAGDAEPSAKGYGWPQPVERLPAVPPYEPATGFDLIPVATEPTEVVPAWPVNDERPGRIRLPRSWATRNEKPEAQPKRRPRPRPRPEDAPVDHSTVYVSRHAAEPPR